MMNLFVETVLFMCGSLHELSENLKDWERAVSKDQFDFHRYCDLPFYTMLKWHVSGHFSYRSYTSVNDSLSPPDTP